MYKYKSARNLDSFEKFVESGYKDAESEAIPEHSFISDLL